MTEELTLTHCSLSQSKLCPTKHVYNIAERIIKSKLKKNNKINTHKHSVQLQKENIRRTHMFPFPAASPSPNEAATGLHLELTILLLSPIALHYMYTSLTGLGLFFFFCTLYK